MIRLFTPAANDVSGTIIGTVVPLVILLIVLPLIITLLAILYRRYLKAKVAADAQKKTQLFR